VTGLQIRRNDCCSLLVTIAPHHSQKFLCRVLLKIPAVIFSSFEKLHFFWESGPASQPILYRHSIFWSSHRRYHRKGSAAFCSFTHFASCCCGARPRYYICTAAVGRFELRQPYRSSPLVQCCCCCQVFGNPVAAACFAFRVYARM